MSDFEDDGEHFDNGFFDDVETDHEISDEEEEIPSDDKHSSKQTERISLGERKTDQIMTKYEYSRLISTLAKMYEKGLDLDPDLISIVEQKKLIDPLDVAELHIKMGIQCPIKIIRPLPNGKVEIWKVSEMILPYDLINFKN